ncbi:MAG TPA: hypothetical protein VFR41_12115 [Acidimicrobiia bacterium]|nr:hypothetical protein [Acidimicrobiia bacterium]
MRKALLAAGIVVCCWSAAAAAASHVVEPTSDPYHVRIDAHAQPVAFAIRVDGFTPGTQLYAEQCDGLDPKASSWTPVRDCDAHAFPQPVVVGRDGTATFPAVRPFSGASPQGLFNCLALGAKSPRNGLVDYRDCRVRVSSNVGFATPDQLFVRIVLGSDSSGGSQWWIAIVGAVIALALIAGLVIGRRRRA